MARTKNKKRKIWADILCVIALGLWAYFADSIIVGACMESFEFPIIGETVAGVVPVTKIWVFLIGVLFYLLTSTLAWSRFIGWLGSMIVMTEIMLVEPLQRIMTLVETMKGLKESLGETYGLLELTKDPDVQAAIENYGIYPWRSAVTWIRFLTYIGAALMAFMLVYFIVILIKDRKAKNTTTSAVRNSIIFLVIMAVFVFIPGLLMGTGPQWLFIAFMTLLAFVTYIYGVIKRSKKNTPVAAAAVTIVLMLVMAVLDMCYRSGFGSMTL